MPPSPKRTLVCSICVLHCPVHYTTITISAYFLRLLFHSILLYPKMASHLEVEWTKKQLRKKYEQAQDRHHLANG